MMSLLLELQGQPLRHPLLQDASESPFLHVQLPRRTFLKGVAATLLAFGLSSQGMLPVSLSLSRVSLDQLTKTDFERLLGERFRLLQDAQLLGEVHLDMVRDRSRSVHKQSAVAFECFSLSFRSAPQLAIPQGTYTFAHPKLGQVDLFIVPAAPTKDEQRYIAIINRI